MVTSYYTFSREDLLLDNFEDFLVASGDLKVTSGISISILLLLLSVSLSDCYKAINIFSNLSSMLEVLPFYFISLFLGSHCGNFSHGVVLLELLVILLRSGVVPTKSLLLLTMKNIS